jgi:hypothetical protein
MAGTKPGLVELLEELFALLTGCQRPAEALTARLAAMSSSDCSQYFHSGRRCC